MSGENLSKEAVVETLRRKWDAMQNHLDERGRRFGRRPRLRQSGTAADHDFVPPDAPRAYPYAEYLRILADGGGANGSRRRQR
jgi:hypothetical protein